MSIDFAAAASPVKDRVARSVFWVVWSRGVVQLISFVSTIVVARLLSPTDYGLMALAGIWSYTIALLAELGLGPAIVQFRDLDDRELNTCFWLIIGTTALGYLVLYAAAPGIAAWFNSPMLAPVLRVVGLNLLLVAARTVPDSLLRKRLELDRISQAEIVAVLVTTPVVLSLAWSGAGVWALVTGSLVMPLTQNIVCFWFARWRPGLRVGSRRLVEILRYSVAALGARVSWVVFQQADAFVLGKVGGDVVLGFYSMAKQLATLPVDKVSVVLNQFSLPIMAGFQDDRGALRASFLRALRLAACLTVPSCIGMALVADDLVYFALGDKWVPMVPLLRVLCAFGLVHALAVLLPPVLFARYRAAFVFSWTIGLLLVMPVAFWASAVRFGALGVALALAVVYPIMTARLARRVLTELDVDWKALWRELRAVLGAALVMAACVVVVRSSISGSDWLPRALRLGLGSSLGALVYALTIVWWGGRVGHEIAELAGWLFRQPSPQRSL